MYHKEFEIGTVPLSENEFDTIEVESLEHCGTIEDLKKRPIKYIVTTNRQGVYRVFLASETVCSYHVNIAQKFEKSNSVVVGGGRIFLHLKNDHTEMVYHPFSEAFGAVPQQLRHKIVNVLIPKLAEHFQVNNIQHRPFEGTKEVPELYWSRIHLSWLRFDQVYQAALKYFAGFLKDKYCEKIIKDMEMHYDQWRKEEVDDLEVLEKWGELLHDIPSSERKTS